MATFPPPDLLSSGQVVIVTDQILSPADFLLHRTLASHFKDHKDARCIVLLVSESISRWNAIASRATVNLAALIESQALRFLDMVKDIQPHLGTDDSTRSTLVPLINEVRSLLQQQGDVQADQPTLILLDDISTLEWMGYATNELAKFLRALSILARKGNASLVVRHHVITPDTPDELFRFLLQLCTYHIDVRPLSSGRSGAVNGEISLYRGPSNGTAHVKTIPRQHAVQYRLTDAAAVYFEKGTGQAVL
ncbi:hypothetical protein NEOLEDRAFT_1150189 [Neolentinus lepideus HHB14362 ss-1]|uniref:Elongator complex protein 5 n=1 Tax=Neolentinus lepideus HHB14362 ss-1 TaxID=1314782 RepID=A0A165QBW6_9AGAM|nr:hypothetical protein NEOLEDRAFT_1150189 [Neolentinus lepideus HHB14362 ss-1]